MRINEAVIDCLATNGIVTLFGIPGKQALPLNESIGERDDIEFVMARYDESRVPQWDSRVSPRRFC